jgi:hypothetical protein
MRSVLIWVAVVAGLVLGVWLLLHVFISPVNPKQQPPESHYAGSCWACHIVSNTAEIRTP